MRLFEILKKLFTDFLVLLIESLKLLLILLPAWKKGFVIFLDCISKAVLFISVGIGTLFFF